MGKIRRLRLKSRKHHIVPGVSPGSISLHEDALPPQITVRSFNQHEFLSESLDDIRQLQQHFGQHTHLRHWVHIQGLGDLEIFSFLGSEFGVNKLVLEDIVNLQQRPKVDEFDSYLFSVSRMLYVNDELEIENEQLSFLLFENIIFSFQESYADTLGPVVQRLEGGKGNIRTAGTAYILYSLTDVVVDNYFKLIYRLGEELDTIEELLYRRSDRLLIFQTQTIKQAMILIRRSAWPERDKVNDLIRSDSPLIDPLTKTFLRDTYDHCMQVIDLVESYKDLTTSLVDMNLSLVSNKMNEIMKVLTIISSIFIPLTFIAGVYGMNFAYQDPETGKILAKNMPELYSENGYVYTMAGMATIGVLQMLFFWHKGWLNRSPRKEDFGRN